MKSSITVFNVFIDDTLASCVSYLVKEQITGVLDLRVQRDIWSVPCIVGACLFC